MNVINPAATSHTLQVVPRFYPAGDVLVKLYDKFTREEISIQATPVILDGYLYVSFDKAFKNNDDFTVTIEEESEIVYRGKLFATDQYQDTQNYKLTKDIFDYGQA